MKINSELDQLRAGVPGCTTVAYADLSSGLVLSVSAARRQPQELLDVLCATAAGLLDGDVADAASEVLEQEHLDLAFRFLPTEVLAVLRSPTDPAEALCCVASGEVDLPAMIDRARETLARIGGAG